ncbi:PaREP1 family protein [Pyrobaculum sp. 3827-6]|uniref:PaREP1 family protein n=1 Tax=Pyrobaculum sp. 3827-6 TaxID=2983604 RepID=UPI0021D7D9FD|nr:PaREP1 family protein [Pyrobaculum sp. 3827-6]MCU7787763.1 PaREP1 family protein [Pyrobaculum sp. 3827-6]
MDVVLAKTLDKPLPKPTSEGYVTARLLEALVEARLALRYLEEGLVRNAAGKAFQAWRAFMAALLRLELDKLKSLAKTEEERKWLESTAVPRLPTGRMKTLSQMLEQIGHPDISLWTDKALDLHDYQYHGPDPDMALSKYRSSEEAAYDVVKLVQGVIRYAEFLKLRVKWSQELEKALEELKTSLR